MNRVLERSYLQTLADVQIGIADISNARLGEIFRQFVCERNHNNWEEADPDELAAFATAFGQLLGYAEGALEVMDANESNN